MPLTGRISNFVVPGTSERQILGPNPRRFLLGFSCDSAGPVYLRNDPLGAVAGGINVVNTSGQYEYPVYKYGDLIQNPFFVFNSTATAVNIGIIEVED